MAIGAVVALGLFVRVWGLWDFCLTPDEGLVLLISSQPTIPEVLAAASYHPHPPLRYIVLHYMLYISDNPLFLRSFAILPGVALIPLLFLLGRRIAGTAAGITMATLAAFSHEAMMLSEVLRTYMLGTFFMTAGLYAFFAYMQEHRPKYLYLYSAAMTLGLLSHYFAMLPITAVSLVWLYYIVRSQRPLNEAIRAALANLPVAVVALASYILHFSGRYGHFKMNDVTRGWLAPEFPDTVLGFAVNAVRLFTHLFLPTNAWWMIALTALGIAALWVTKRRDVAMVIILTFAVNIVLTAAGKYPFGGVRQGIYLLPLVLMSVGAAVQFGWDRARPSFKDTADSGFVQWASAHRRAISYVALACFVAFLARVSYGIAQSEFLRHYYGRGWGELPLMRDDVTGALRYVRDQVGTGDILLADRQTTFYVRLANGQAPEAVSRTVSRLTFDGLVLFHSNQNYTFYFGSEDILWRSFEDLLRHVEIGDDTTIWVVSIGWQQIKRTLGGMVCGPLMVDGWARGGAGVYGFRGSEVAAEVERRFGRGTAEPNTPAETPR